MYRHTWATRSQATTPTRRVARLALAAAFVLSFVVSAFVAVGVPSPDPTIERLPASTVFSESEDLVYEVSWTFFKVGTIHIKSTGKLKAMAYIDSYEGLPFVDLHSVHYAEMDSMFCSRGGYAIDKNGEEWQGLQYVPDPATGTVAIEQLHQTSPDIPPYKRIPGDTVSLPSREFVDGLSIGYFPRLFMQSVTTVVIPTLLRGKLGATTFYFTGTRTTESIDALEDPVRVVLVAGTTDVVGVFGMTGDFAGWFSDDEAAVPIKGKLKVLLGNVTIELIRWKRNSWKPPQ
jgi:hypothetical protein